MAERTVPELLDSCAAAAPEQQVVLPDGRLSWPELRDLVRSDAAALLGLGVRPGDRVAVLLHGGVDAVRYWLAACAIGAIAVPFTVRMREHEAAHLVTDAEPVVLLTTSEFLPVLDAHLPDRPDGPLRTVVVLDRAGPDTPQGVTGRDALAAAAARTPPSAVERAGAAVGPDTPAIMLYTSGTTSRPRGCVHKHRSLADEGTAVAERLRLTPADRFWTPLPMFHCGGYDVALAALAGRPLRHMEAVVVDPASGAPVAPGTPGEFRFRGTSRMAYYHRDPGTTAARIDDGGWFASGDQVVADADGRLAFRSRLADVLKVGGENVAAAEVEGFLGDHPAAGVVQVVGAPDARYGEVPCAFVELRAGHEPSPALAEEMIAFCRGRIAGYKVPRYVRFVREWPMSGTKVQKFRLKTLITEEITGS